MNTDTVVSTPAVAATRPVTHLNSQPQSVTWRVLKLGLDLYLQEHVVALQYDGCSPKLPQRFKPKDFPAGVEKQIGYRASQALPDGCPESDARYRELQCTTCQKARAPYHRGPARLTGADGRR